jgi:hypothetical protein
MLMSPFTRNEQRQAWLADVTPEPDADLEKSAERTPGNSELERHGVLLTVSKTPEGSGTSEETVPPEAAEFVRQAMSFLRAIEARGTHIKNVRTIPLQVSADLPAKERWLGEHANPNSLTLTLASRFASFSGDWHLQPSHVSLALAAIERLGEARIRDILAKPLSQHAPLKNFLFTQAAADALRDQNK